MKTFKVILLLSALLLVLGACTKKNNLTGTNWSDVKAIIMEDATSLEGGFSFAPDTLVSIKTGRKSLLVGNWQGSHASSLIRFSALPTETILDTYTSLQDAKLDLVVLRRDSETRNPLNLKIYKVNRTFTEPDSLSATDYEYVADAVVPGTLTSSDTISVALPAELIKNWQTDADSTGLNFLIAPEEGVEGFAELRLSSSTQGSKLSYTYKATAEAEDAVFNSFSSLETYSYSHPEATPVADTWRLSNFNPQRMYVDIQPDFTLYKDNDGNTLSAEDLKRVNINKAELVLFIDKDKANLHNAFSYFVSAFLVKEKPQTPETIDTDNMEAITFAYPLTSSAQHDADSLCVNITPIIQAYTSGKKEAKGIVIMSNYERKDFGEIEFHHPNSAPGDKTPYIRVKYTPPFL
ncbi:MAG: hypothetical protein PHO35_07490 [Candidatus Cloacimonetes bacterium]|nr:hypothetical protein [Candidatus Cloacimonadota bacterium]